MSRNSQKSPRVTVIAGGGQNALTQYPELAGDAVIIVDAKDELDKLVLRERPGQRVFQFAVGKTETLSEILADAPADMKALAKERPISLSAGAGQFRLYGGYLIDALVKSRQFRKVLHEELIPFMLAKFAGRISDVVVEVLFGSAGGMGSLGARVIGEFVAHELIASLGWKVELEFNAIGAMSYVGLGDGIIPNSSASNAEFVLKASKPPDSDRLTISYVTGEILPLGHDAATRARHVNERLMAMNCKAVRAMIGTVKPNKSAHSKFGGCRLVEVDRFDHIPSEFVAAQIAAELMPHVDSLRRVLPNLSVISSLAFDVQSAPLPRESVQSIIKRAELVSFEEFHESVSRPGARHRIAVKADTIDGVRLDLTAARTTFAVPLKTVSETQERLTWLKTSVVLIKRKAKEFEEELETLEHALDKIRRNLRLAFAVFTQQRAGLPFFWMIVAYVLSIILPDEVKSRWLENAIAKVREQLDEQEELRAKLAALRSAAAGILHEQDAIDKALATLWNGLERLRPKGEFATMPSYVTPGPLEDVWPELLHLDPRDAKRQLLELLPTTVQFVTLDGLALIVRAADARVDEVLQAMRSKAAVMQGPPFGGLERVDAGMQILVLPPVEPALQAKLSDAFRETSHETLAFADTCVPSVNVVGLRVYFCETREDLLPQMYRQGLQAASQTRGYLTDRSVLQSLGFENTTGEHTNGKLYT